MSAHEAPSGPKKGIMGSKEPKAKQVPRTCCTCCTCCMIPIQGKFLSPFPPPLGSTRPGFYTLYCSTSLKAGPSPESSCRPLLTQAATLECLFCSPSRWCGTPSRAVVRGCTVRGGALRGRAGGRAVGGAQRGSQRHAMGKPIRRKRIHGEGAFST